MSWQWVRTTCSRPLLGETGPRPIFKETKLALGDSSSPDAPFPMWEIHNHHREQARASKGDREKPRESSVPGAEPGTVLWGMMNYEHGRMRLPHTSMNTGLLPLTHSNGLLPLSTPSYWGELARFRTTSTQGSLRKKEEIKCVCLALPPLRVTAHNHRNNSMAKKRIIEKL